MDAGDKGCIAVPHVVPCLTVYVLQFEVVACPRKIAYSSPESRVRKTGGGSWVLECNAPLSMPASGRHTQQ